MKDFIETTWCGGLLILGFGLYLASFAMADALQSELCFLLLIPAAASIAVGIAYAEKEK